jgi:hypothetical protein
MVILLLSVMLLLIDVLIQAPRYVGSRPVAMGCNPTLRPLQNQRSGSSAESRIRDFIGKCGGLPTRRHDGWEFCRGFYPAFGEWFGKSLIWSN